MEAHMEAPLGQSEFDIDGQVFKHLLPVVKHQPPLPQSESVVHGHVQKPVVSVRSQ
jgi:hypothetical protein